MQFEDALAAVFPFYGEDFVDRCIQVVDARDVYKRQATFIKEERIDSPILVGHSMGGGLALAVAADFPTPVSYTHLDVYKRQASRDGQRGGAGNYGLQHAGYCQQYSGKHVLRVILCRRKSPLRPWILGGFGSVIAANICLLLFFYFL